MNAISIVLSLQTAAGATNPDSSGVMLTALIRGIVSALIYSGIGLSMFALAFFIIHKAVPFSLRKEIEEDQNVALGLVLASVIVGIAMIVSAAVHG